MKRISMIVPCIEGRYKIFAKIDVNHYDTVGGLMCSGRSRREARVRVKQELKQYIDDTA